MICSKLFFLKGFLWKLALSSVCSIPEHGCPQSDPSPVPLSEPDWSRTGFSLGSGGTWLLCGFKGTRAVPPVARCENRRAQVLLHVPASWGPCSSWRFKARQFPVCLSLACLLLTHQAEPQTTAQGRTAVALPRRHQVLGEPVCQECLLLYPRALV